MPVFLRKKVQDALDKTPAPPMPGKGKEEDTPEPEGALRCPKCGMELADTEENREYAKARGDEMESEDESEDEESEEYED